MAATDWAVVFATLVGPILAVWASEWRHQRRQARQRREDLVFTLMSTRGNRQAPEHIHALNRIEIVFPDRKYPLIADAWRQYHRHLFDAVLLKRDLAAWQEKGNQLFASLLDTSAKSIGIEFPMDSIKNAAYYPVGLVMEAQQTAEMRQLFIQMMNRMLAQAAPTPTKDRTDSPLSSHSHPSGSQV
jgi:hypothetical protein